MIQASDIHDTALRYARRGWPVLPVSNSKVPLIPDWPNRATTKPATIHEWVKAERADLTTRGSELTQQIDAAWCASLAEFERALERLAAHHAECCREFGVRGKTY